MEITTESIILNTFSVKDVLNVYDIVINTIKDIAIHNMSLSKYDALKCDYLILSYTPMFHCIVLNEFKNPIYANPTIACIIAPKDTFISLLVPNAEYDKLMNL